MVWRVLVTATAGASLIGCEGLQKLADDYQKRVPLDSREPTPVSPEIETILDAWQKNRARTKSVYSVFNYSLKDLAFRKEWKSSGSLRYRHPDSGRIDIRQRSTVIWSKGNELWEARVPERQVQIFEWSDPNKVSEPMLFAYLRDSQYVWFTPSDKMTIQKQGKVSKIGENEKAVTICVERKDKSVWGLFDKAIVQLRKSDYLPMKLIVRESADIEYSFEFTEVHENVELDDAQFAKPKLKDSEWSIRRNPFVPMPTQATNPADRQKRGIDSRQKPAEFPSSRVDAEKLLNLLVVPGDSIEAARERLLQSGFKHIHDGEGKRFLFERRRAAQPFVDGVWRAVLHVENEKVIRVATVFGLVGP